MTAKTQSKKEKEKKESSEGGEKKVGRKKKMKLHGQARGIHELTVKPDGLPVERNPVPRTTIHPRVNPWSSGTRIEAPLARATKPKKPDTREGEESPFDEKSKRERYFETVGRRKTAIARVRLYTRAGDFLVNEKPYQHYFPTIDLQKIAEDALQKMKLLGRFKVTVKIFGGGIHAQAEALRHGLARALTKFNPDFRKRLKRAGFLKRDPRMKERKKFGLKKARRAPQWAKR